MTGSQKLLLAGGLLLAVLGMSYGLWYAVFDEHQTLERIGVSLATGFAEAAAGKLPEGYAALEDYGATRFAYIREVHAHGHWILLGTALMVLGLVFDKLAFREGVRFSLALVLVVAAGILPLGALLETALRGALPSALALAGSIALIGCLAMVALGFILPVRKRDTTRE